MRFTIIAGTAIIAGGLAYIFWPNAEGTVQATPVPETVNGAMVSVQLPATFSQNAQIGKMAYDGTCAACHGTNAVGQDGVAPPLIHKIYEPNHHGDESFQLAAERGVRAHHWSFGNMPPVEGITRGDVTMIIAYIRELQRTNGIN